MSDTKPMTPSKIERAEGGVGPWRLSAGDEHTVFDQNECKLVTVPCGGMSGRTFDEATDCARLIAASPKLLEAVKAASALASCCIAQGCYSHDELSAMARAIRPTFEAALTEARGEA